MQRELDYKDRHFRDGRYNGEYFDAASNGRSIVIEVTFSGGKVAGHGEASGQAFQVSGTYSDKPPFDVTLNCVGEGIKIELAGSRQDTGALQGRWKNKDNESDKGLFELVPLGVDTADPSKAIEQLVAMGFDRAQAERAVNELRLPIDAATEWISNGCPNMQPRGSDASDDAVRAITDMGFDAETARNALRETGNNVEAAIARLVG